MDCPDDNALSELVEGALPFARLAQIEAHVERCAECRSLLVALAPALDSDPEADAVAAKAWDTVLGSRYVPEQILGAGGMSIVYRGRDQMLDRPVALKVMLDAPADLRAWLRREARALAMLSHPNVVAVYDVDLSEGSTFLACELVEGGNLRAWAAERPRSLSDKLVAILDAVRGLEAAHAMGVVHRDVTPNNILVGSDGRARVSDFGLARLGPTVETAPEASVDEAESGSEEAGPQRTGVVGTPGYIAPEILDGLDATPASDQYGLCVTAYELLHGHLPDERPPQATRTVVPRAIDRVLAQGMRPDPRARHPSMRALRRALTQACRPPWRSRAMMAGAVVVAGAALGLGAATPTPPCGGASRLAPVTLAVDTSALPARVSNEVARYAEDWTAARERTCVAADDRTVGAAALDRRWACLRDRHDAVAGLVEVFSTRSSAPGRVAEELTLLEQIPPPSVCEDDARLERAAPLPPPEIAAEVETLAAKLRRARSILWGDERSRTAVAEVLQAAARLRYDPLTARALMYRGQFEREGGDVAKARETLEAAALLATSSGADGLAVYSWLDVMSIEVYGTQDLRAALALLPQVDAALARLGRPADLLASRAGALALIHDAAAEFEQAHGYHEDALRYTASARGRDSIAYAEELNNFAAHENRRSNLPGARAKTEQALEIIRSRLGEGSLNEALLLRNLAVLAAADGDGAQAVSLAERSVEIARKHLDAQDVRMGPMLTTLGHAKVAAGHAEEGVVALERALALTRRHRPAGHTMVVDARRILADGYVQAERLDDADRELGRALADLGEGSVYFRALLSAERGVVRARLGRIDEASALCDEAQDLAEGVGEGDLLDLAAQCRQAARADDASGTNAEPA